MNKIACLGSGSWGTALAIHLARNGQTVRLWGNEVAQVEKMAAERCNDYFLPGIILPEKIEFYTDLAKTLDGIQDILIAVPSHAFRSVLTQIQPLLAKNARIVWATKGLDPHNHDLLHIVAQEVLGNIPLAVISGPTFAKEVAMGLPTAITLASTSQEFTQDLIQRFHNQKFRVYHTNDLVGVELGGAMKNVLAIAVGIADGLGFGANARSAIITRGLAEMVRLGLILGGQKETFMGLAGMGDLVLTCTDNQSRNRRFGLALGAGKQREPAEKEIGQVVEGIKTALEIHHLAKRKNVETPICEQVYKVLYENLTPREAVTALLSREPRAEGF